MARVFWPQSVRDARLELPEKDRQLILEKVGRLERFPRLYPVRARGRFRRNRRFLAGHGLVYYRVVGEAVYIRANGGLTGPPEYLSSAGHQRAAHRAGQPGR